MNSISKVNEINRKLNPLSANPTRCANNSLATFTDHFMRLAHKGVINKLLSSCSESHREYIYGGHS